MGRHWTRTKTKLVLFKIRDNWHDVYLEQTVSKYIVLTTVRKQHHRQIRCQTLDTKYSPKPAAYWGYTLLYYNERLLWSIIFILLSFLCTQNQKQVQNTEKVSNTKALEICSHTQAFARHHDVSHRMCVTGKGKNVSMDKFFTSLSLANMLIAKKTGLLTTTSKTRQELSPPRKNQHIVKTIFNNMADSWQDNSDTVHMQAKEECLHPQCCSAQCQHQHTEKKKRAASLTDFHTEMCRLTVLHPICLTGLPPAPTVHIRNV